MKTFFYMFIAFIFIYNANDFKNSIESDENNQLVKNSLSNLDKIIIKDNSLEMLPTTIALETDLWSCWDQCDATFLTCTGVGSPFGTIGLLGCISDWRACMGDCIDTYPVE